MHTFRSQKNTVRTRNTSRAPRLELLEDRRLLAVVGPDGFGYRADATPALDYDLDRNDFDVVVLHNEQAPDDAAAQINLGADTFNFYGENHSTIWVSTNGLINVGPTGNTAFLNSNLTNTPPQRTIAPFWDDLITKTSGDSVVMYMLEDRNNNGTPERLIIEWQNVIASQLGTEENTLTFQAVLELNTGTRAGDIFFNYIDLDAGTENGGEAVTDGALATIGIKDVGPQGTGETAKRLLIDFNRTVDPRPIPITSGAAIRITTQPIGGDTTPPSMSAANFDPLGAQPLLTLQFSEDVSASLQSTDLELMNLRTNTPVTPPAPVYNSLTNEAVYTFNPANLPDGNYRATIRAGSIQDASNNANPTDLTVDFYVLTGDANRDRAVDFNDLAALAQNYNQSGGKTFAQGDFNYDGDVNFDDLALLAQRYNSSLPAPAPAAPVAAAAPATASVGRELTSPGRSTSVFSTTRVAPRRPAAPARRR